ncbi:putative glucan endo-1,3-beta-glucosidase precursor [Tothia fuscella]|uniref:Glucan endo-1,3-beta-glucosidase n=1 Tax=Tothia fuscella TaxID=1048955 RepID=A0A9P4P193_9PEZI|nr:putative glucan endo-1,3-beta-glucosidase precursor [Tothia fuscella]
MSAVKRFFDYAKRGFKPKNPKDDKNPAAAAPVQHNVVQPQQSDPAIPPAQVPIQRSVQTDLAGPPPPLSTTATNPTLDIELVNRSNSSNVWAYITGLASNQNNALFLLSADGTTPYYPTQPPATGTALRADCAIKLGGPGASRTVTIPQIAGGRIWFSIDGTLTFLLNPGPALVEPSVTNQADPNININWGFAEFTYNSTQIYANISYVDFVSIPISLTLTDGNNNKKTVTGMPANGFDKVCSEMLAQTQRDKVPGWANCIVKSNGRNLRVLSPNNHILLSPNDFQGYWEPYVEQVWQKYSQANTNLTVRAENVNAIGRIQDGQFNLSNELFARPSTIDVFSANTGPFTTGSSGRRNQLIPQLAAAFNRSTLLSDAQTPATKEQFYKDPITNHYSRIVHAANVDGIGYGFPYDDVEPPGGGDQSGYVSGVNPKVLTVTVGGGQWLNL